MAENKKNADMNKYLFINLVTMLSISAMQQLGKIINPATGKTELSLEAAQATIDTLDMLAEKTKNNLEAEETKLMQDTLSMLKMNFVETKEMQKSECRMQNAESQKTAKQPEDTAAKSEPHAREKSESEPASETAKDPKFRKSYG
jgi:hypothetical protein